MMIMKRVIKCVVACMLSLPLVGFAASVDLSFTPTPKNVVGVNTTFTVDIAGHYNPDATEVLVGGSLGLAFDQTILRVNSVTLHVPRELDASLGTINNALGSVQNIGFASFVGVPGGVFNFATVEFESLGVGTSALTLADSQSATFVWANGEGDPVAFNALAGEVNVSAVPLPAAAWLLCSGVIGLIGIGRRKSAH